MGQDQDQTRQLSPDQVAAAVKASEAGAITALPVGAVLQEYRLDSVLGIGGFGITYLANDTNLNCKVAIKEFFPSSVVARMGGQAVQPQAPTLAASFDVGLKQFLDEARTLATFRHPNILRVLRFFQANQTAYMVMEYEEGESLSSWVVNRGQPDRAMIFQVLLPLLSGLEAVHATGFLHRDIKPSNIVMRPNRTPVLLDFGAARNLTTESGHTITAIVTPGFAPFEQYHSHGKQGPWSDLYALGAVLYWMVTGNKPVEALARVKDDPLPRATEAADQALYGKALLEAIDWALAMDEDKRPQTVAEFRRALPQGDAPTQAVLAGPRVAFAPELLAKVEDQLTRHVGPLAKVLVKKTAQVAADARDLCQMLSREIPDEAHRLAFLKETSSHWQAAGSAPVAKTQTVAVKPGTVPAKAWLEQEAPRAEARLAKYIGPLARVLVKKVGASAATVDEFYAKLAEQIENPGERQAFLASREPSQKPR
jgi:serine/threonine protein kinase